MGHHVGDDRDALGREAGGDQAPALEVGQRGVHGDVVEEEAELARDDVADGVAGALEEAALASLEDAMVFAASDASLADLAMDHVQTIGADQAIVVDGHDNGHAGATAFAEDRGGDEGIEVVDVDKVGALAGEHRGDRALGRPVIDAGEEGLRAAESPAHEVRAGAGDSANVGAVARQQGTDLVDDHFLAAGAAVGVVEDADPEGISNLERST